MEGGNCLIVVGLKPGSSCNTQIHDIVGHILFIFFFNREGLVENCLLNNNVCVSMFPMNMLDLDGRIV